MEFVQQFVDIFLHLDTHLARIIQDYGTWTYAILFLIIFCETGLVVLPLLPGDSLLFAAGTFAALGSLNPLLLLALLITAAILGDTVNYWIGKRIGPRAFSGKVRFLKKSHLDRTRDFYASHGGKTIIIARFLPIVRTFAPFVAGVGEMYYPRFLAYNVIGGVIWVTLFTMAGYWFGTIPTVKDNFGLVILVIILMSVLPVAYELIASRRRGRRKVA
jgi:membrane-associated protein